MLEWCIDPELLVLRRVSYFHYFSALVPIRASPTPCFHPFIEWESAFGGA